MFDSADYLKTDEDIAPHLKLLRRKATRLS